MSKRPGSQTAPRAQRAKWQARVMGAPRQIDDAKTRTHRWSLITRPESSDHSRPVPTATRSDNERLDQWYMVHWIRRRLSI